MENKANEMDLSSVNNMVLQLKGKREKYEVAIELAKSSLAEIDLLSDGANDINTLLSQIVISGIPVGDNVFGDIRGKVANYNELINDIIGTCNTKIEELDGGIGYYQSKLSSIDDNILVTKS